MPCFREISQIPKGYKFLQLALTAVVIVKRMITMLHAQLFQFIKTCHSLLGTVVITYIYKSERALHYTLYEGAMWL